MITRYMAKINIAHMDKNLHGHTARLYTLFTGELDKEEEKKLNNIIERITDSYIFNLNSKVEDTIARILESEEKKTFMMWEPTSTQNIAYRIAKEIIDILPEKFDSVELYDGTQEAIVDMYAVMARR